MNLREVLESHGINEELIKEAERDVIALRAAGYNEETVEALCESYFEESTVIKDEFTLEKLMMAIDPDEAFASFWEDTNA